jgi:hypothetical protein
MAYDNGEFFFFKLTLLLTVHAFNKVWGSFMKTNIAPFLIK